MEFVEVFMNTLSVDSPIGVVILLWMGNNMQTLNRNVAIIINRVDSHEQRIGRVEDKLLK